MNLATINWVGLVLAVLLLASPFAHDDCAGEPLADAAMCVCVCHVAHIDDNQPDVGGVTDMIARLPVPDLPVPQRLTVDDIYRPPVAA